MRLQPVTMPVMQNSGEKRPPQCGGNRRKQRNKGLHRAQRFPFIMCGQGLGELREIRLNLDPVSAHFVEQSLDRERAVFHGSLLTDETANNGNQTSWRRVRRNTGEIGQGSGIRTAIESIQGANEQLPRRQRRVTWDLV